MALTDHQRRQAFEFHASGMSYRAIARQVGCPSDSTIRMLFIKKKPKQIPTTPRKMPAKPKTKSKTPSVLTHRVRFPSTSVPMRRHHDYPVLAHTPTRNELYAMLHQAVRNTQC